MHECDYEPINPIRLHVTIGLYWPLHVVKGHPKLLGKVLWIKLQKPSFCVISGVSWFCSTTVDDKQNS